MDIHAYIKLMFVFDEWNVLRSLEAPLANQYAKIPCTSDNNKTTDELAAFKVANRACPAMYFDLQDTGRS